MLSSYPSYPYKSPTVEYIKHFYESILSLPHDFILKIKNTCERALLLDLAHVGFRIDHLLGALHETMYSSKVIKIAQDKIKVNTDQENGTFAMIPILESAVSSCQQRITALENLLNQAVIQLQSYHPPCLQLSQVYECTGMELMNEGIVKLGAEKLIL